MLSRLKTARLTRRPRTRTSPPRPKQPARPKQPTSSRTESGSPAEPPGHGPSRRRRIGGVRGRILLSYIVLLGLAGLISVLVVRQVLIVRVDDRVQQDLAQEVEEFQTLARNGNDPHTGEPLRDHPKRLFRLFLQRNVPAEGEELITIPRNGRPRYQVTERAEENLIEREDLYAQWQSVDQVERGELDTSAGPVRYVAVPVELQGRTVGTFVVANFMQGELEEMEEAVLVVAIVAGIVLLLGIALAFIASGRVVAPLRQLRDAARSVTGADMTRRIEVTGKDELAELAETFNRMLDRIESAFTSQKEFIRDMSHELRTPIAIVRGHLELLAEEGTLDRNERREVYELVTDELSRMTRLVEELLDLTRAERPDFLRFQTVQIGKLAEEMIAKARSMAPREWVLDGTSPRTVVADPQRLTQAIVGIVDNAIKHTDEGDRIAIGAAVNGREARLWVRDSGPGISEEEQTSIFERFERGSETRRRYDGTGLGLAIARAIAEAHGGRIELKNMPGAGARFDLIIPVDQAEQADLQAEEVTA
jgi:signal transduction histidine kinase